MKNLLSTLSDSLIGKVLGAHELFIVEHIHHNKELSWNAKRSSLTVTKQKNRLVNVSHASFLVKCFLGHVFSWSAPSKKVGFSLRKSASQADFLRCLCMELKGSLGETWECGSWTKPTEKTEI